MQLSKGFLVLGGITLALVIFILFASFSVTRPFTFPEAHAELTVRRGTVELERSGELVWSPVTEPTEVFEGDSLRTGEESEASINLYDQGVLHVAENSVMVIDASVWDPENPEVFQGEMNLKSGNVWSRVFNFVSPESDFRVRTSSTVATVRGTTFWVGALSPDTSRVYVDEHTVGVTALETGDELDVTTGEMAKFEKVLRGDDLQMVPPPEGDDLELIKKYREWDDKYEKALHARQLAFAREVRPFDPGTSLYTFQRFAERLRLLLALREERRDELRARFMAGRILDAYIELTEYHDLDRTQILLNHAERFGGDRIAHKVIVRRAKLYFDRLRQVEGEEAVGELVSEVKEDNEVDDEAVTEPTPVKEEVKTNTTPVSTETVLEAPTGTTVTNEPVKNPEVKGATDEVVAPEPVTQTDTIVEPTRTDTTTEQAADTSTDTSSRDASTTTDPVITAPVVTDPVVEPVEIVPIDTSSLRYTPLTY